MSGLRSRHWTHTIVCILTFTMLLNALPAIAVHGNLAACTQPYCSTVRVSPGKYSRTLGTDFPTFASVKLSYPNSSILTNSTGDLLFKVNLSPPKTDRNITVNGMLVPNASLYRSVDIYIPPDFTSLTTSQLWTSFTNDYDPNSLSLSRGGGSDQIGPNWWRVSVRNIIVTANLGFVASRSNLTANGVFETNKTQYVRLFQVTSPSIAGRYFFKAFLNGTSIGPDNFPTLVVEGTNDPAYISGTLRDIGYSNSSEAGKPVNIPPGYGARVVATGIDYLGRTATAQTFINSTAEGQYTLFGLAAGTYNLTAYVAGYVPTIRPLRVSVLPAQSLENIDIYLPRSANVTGVVFSRTGDGVPLRWGSLFGFGGTTPRSIIVRMLSPDNIVVASTPAPYRPTLFTDPSATTFAFSIYRELGYDGRIPQNYANYTSGLTSGDYYLRAYVTSYIQIDDVPIHIINQTLRTYAEIPLVRTGFFSITVHFLDYSSSLKATNLTLGGTLSVSVYDEAWTLRGTNTTFVLPGSNNATIEVLGFSEARGLGNIGLLHPNYGLPPGTYHIVARFTSSPLYTGDTNVGVRDTYFQLEDVQGIITLASISSYFLPSALSFFMYRGGGILLNVYSTDTEHPSVPVPFAYHGAPITLKIIDSVGNVYTTNSSQPFNNNTRQFFYAGLLTNDYEILAQTVGYQQFEIPRIHVAMGTNSDVSIRMILQPTIDLTLVFKNENLLSLINSTQPYAQPLNHLDATPVRLEVYDDLGNFVAANNTYIPNLTNGSPTTSARFILIGFERYFGDPMTNWSGFYDTTDAARPDEGGLSPGSFRVMVWVDGYYQSSEIQVNLVPRERASVVASMDRASRISGTVIGSTIYNQARLLSWAVVDLEPGNGNYTTFTTDGYYQVWVPSGTYMIGVKLAGYSTRTAQVAVPQGSDLRMDFWLEYFQGSPTFSTAQLLAEFGLATLQQDQISRFGLILPTAPLRQTSLLTPRQSTCLLEQRPLRNESRQRTKRA